jgi:hypothetical protein
MDLQAVLSQQLRANENLTSWHKGRFGLDISVIEWEIDQVDVLLNTLPSSKDRLYATDEPWLQRRTQRIGQLQITIEARVDDAWPRLVSHTKHDDWHPVIRHRSGNHRGHPLRR